jgi:hypothetical protein
MLRHVVAMVAVLVAVPGPARAHCDSLDGPVAKAVSGALAAGRPDAVLVWVKAPAEAELVTAFQKVLAVRRLSAEARDLADRFFLETAIRLHRAGEGEPYTGLKPAGLDPGPAVRAADQAVATGSLAPVEKLLGAAHKAELAERFKPLSGKVAPPTDVAQGRAWVEAYVVFVHYVDGVHGGAEKGCGHGKAHEGAER